MVKFLLSFGFVIVFFGCRHKANFNNLTEVSYSRDIEPIINANCTFSGCHGSVSSEKFKLLTYQEVISGGVKAGSPESSKLYQSLKSLTDDGIMPQKPYRELSEKQIQLIYVWIGQGAKNN